MGVKLAALAAGVIALSASQALAWGDMYMGDGTNNPNGGKIFPYAAKANYCPSGLQPVMVNGVICCGSPNTAHHFYNAPGKRKKKVHHRKRVSHGYAPAGVKGVIYK